MRCLPTWPSTAVLPNPARRPSRVAYAPAVQFMLPCREPAMPSAGTRKLASRRWCSGSLTRHDEQQLAGGSARPLTVLGTAEDRWASNWPGRSDSTAARCPTRSRLCAWAVRCSGSRMPRRRQPRADQRLLPEKRNGRPEATAATSDRWRPQTLRIGREPDRCSWAAVASLPEKLGRADARGRTPAPALTRHHHGRSRHYLGAPAKASPAGAIPAVSQSGRRPLCRNMDE